MEHVFIDTSVFETNNFLEGRRINELFKLSEDGEIRIVLTEITYKEILSRFRKNIKASESAFKAFREKSRAFRNLQSKRALFDTIDEQASVDEFKKDLDARLKRANCLILDYPVVNIGDVFTKYFAKESPFGEGQKKDEFPDAFALLTLEKWCEEQEHKCQVLSLDEDMLHYTSTHLVVAPDYEAFLDETLRAIQKNKDIIDNALSYLTTWKDEVEGPIKAWLFSNLDNMHRYDDVVNYMDVHDIDIKTYAATFDHPKIISVTSETVEIEVEAQISYRVDVEIDDEEQAYFDDDEKAMRYYDTKIARIERSEEIPVLVTITFSDDEEHIEIDSLDVAEINQGKPLEIEDERRYYY